MHPPNAMHPPNQNSGAFQNQQQSRDLDAIGRFLRAQIAYLRMEIFVTVSSAPPTDLVLMRLASV
jgi:hypothetical protein